MKELQKVEDAIAETRKLFNDLNTIRDMSGDTITAPLKVGAGH